MKSKGFVIGACLACALVLAVMCQPGTQAKSDLVGLKIGVVDLQKVVDVYPTKVKLEKELQSERDSAEAELTKMAKEIENLAEELKVLEAKSDMARDKRLLIAEKRAKMSVRKASADYEFVERYKGALQLVFTEVITDLEEFRKSMGYDLIVNVDREPMKAGSLDLIQKQIARKVVLASNGTLDLTDEAIEFIKNRTSKQEK
ncbi:MAG: OmpH family outer membrane protein [Planctomycetes bacterium]|nr:OmpH family outer membrane protein [Planctomycetota bacterium]